MEERDQRGQLEANKIPSLVAQEVAIGAISLVLEPFCAFRDRKDGPRSIV